MTGLNHLGIWLFAVWLVYMAIIVSGIKESGTIYVFFKNAKEGFGDGSFIWGPFIIAAVIIAVVFEAPYWIYTLCF